MELHLYTCLSSPHMMGTECLRLYRCIQKVWKDVGVEEEEEEDIYLAGVNSLLLLKDMSGKLQRNKWFSIQIIESDSLGFDSGSIIC